MEKESTEWMIQESAAGDAGAFRLLFERFYAELFRFAYSRVERREDALDILQEVFIDLWIALRKGGFAYSSEIKFRGFLYTIIRRKLARTYHAKSRSSYVSIEESEGALSYKQEGEAGEIAIVMKAVRKLPAEDREVISLRYFSGLQFQEIAELLNKGESAVKVRHHRALEKLKNMLHYEKE